MITLGGLALLFAVVRIFVFKMPESPRYLLSKGRDLEAVEAVNYVARRNGKPEPLTLSMLQSIDRDLGLAVIGEESGPGRTTSAILKDNLADFHGIRYKALFATKRLAWHTSLIWFIWITIGTHTFTAPL
jgi:FAD/FMN-containing dehydrogenase